MVTATWVTGTSNKLKQKEMVPSVVFSLKELLVYGLVRAKPVVPPRPHQSGMSGQVELTSMLTRCRFTGTNLDLPTFVWSPRSVNGRSGKSPPLVRFGGGGVGGHWDVRARIPSP